MKSLTLLLREVLLDRGTWCGVSTDRDWKTITTRVEHEGLSFLTITLPTYCDELQKALEEGCVRPGSFSLWRKSKIGAGRLPAFLQGFIARVFDPATGELLDEPDVDCIHAIRQITLLLGKINLPCSPERDRKAYARFIQCEKEVRRADTNLAEERIVSFLRLGWHLWGEVFSVLDREIERGELFPRHGPGATADRLLGNAKYRNQQWPRRLDTAFPAGEYLIPNWRYWQHLQSLDLLEPGAELPVRVITVPKTLKSPRIIAIEPTCMQYAQQAVSRRLMDLLESDDFRFKGIVGFTDQTLNQDLAREGSLLGNYATLDLSDASDRVSNQLVRKLLAPWQNLSAAVDASRSRKADVPGYGVIRLAKFASMGSALCFPIESIVFATLALLGIERGLNCQLRRQKLSLWASQVRVYGDDIIVPTDMTSTVVESLHAFGMKVNLGKSFSTGRFRESCGKEYYAGQDVSVVRVRSVLPTRRSDAREVVSAVALRNQMYKSGLWGVAKHLDDVIEPILRFYPIVEPTSPVLGRHSFLGYESQRTCPRLHRPLVKGYVVRAVPPRDRKPLDGIAALLKWFLKQSEFPFADAKHLERSGRPLVVGTKLGWNVPF